MSVEERMPDKERMSDKERGAVAGYLRLSSLTVPAGIGQGPAWEAFLQGIRAPRMTHLAEVAALQNLAISVWYEDFDRSGRGEFLQRRTSFEALTQAARSGRVRLIFAADLSRLFRDLMQQELWFLEMETLGVRVVVPDLPFAIDASTRLLLRQEIGMINEYVAGRTGAILSAILAEKVEQGLWVGRTQSLWGLRYDSHSKGFEFDDATAQSVRHVYLTFNAENGNSYRTAKRLNAEVQAGSPEAVKRPYGGPWDITGIMNCVRSPLYRRIATLQEVAVPAPHLIPEIIPVDVLEETDRLLAERANLHGTVARWLAKEQAPLPYSRRLFCGECGGMLQAYRTERHAGGSPGRYVSWVCNRAATKGLHPGQGCQAAAKLPQFRLHALLSRGLRELFQADKERHMIMFPNLAARKLVSRRQLRTKKGRLSSDGAALFGLVPVLFDPALMLDSGAVQETVKCEDTVKYEDTARWNEHLRQREECRLVETVRREAHRTQKEKLRCGLARNRGFRSRAIDEFASGIGEGRTQLEARLAHLSASAAALKEAYQVLLVQEENHGWRGTVLGKLCTQFEKVWAEDWWLLESPEKDQLVRDLDLRLVVSILPREQPRKTKPRSRSKKGAPYYERQRSGLAQVMLSSSLFRIPADAPMILRETPDELSEYNRLTRPSTQK